MLFRLFLLFSTFINCSYLQKSSSPLSIQFKKEQNLEKETTFKGIKIGGLSELAFDEKTGHLIALSDDKKNHRWYEMTFTAKPEYQVKIINQVFLKSPKSKKLNQNMDPEALLFLKNGAVLIASEGQQVFKEHEPTQIFTFDRKGVLKSAWPVPSVFWQATPDKKASAIGQQENKGFESLTLNKNKGILWTATEQPLKQDLIFKNKSFVRLTAFDIKNKKMLFQYPYFLKDSQDGGLTALEFLKDKSFISLERAYKKRKKNGVNEVHLFLTSCQKAQDVKKHIVLHKKFKACSKNLIWSSSQEKNIKVDNLEGLALSPPSPSNKQTLILVSDDNFNPQNQKTQFLFFDLTKK